MPVTGLPMLGGEYSSFQAAKGNYHVIIVDAALAEAKTGRGQIRIDLTYHNDPNHVAKQGKKLTRMFQSLPLPTDDPEKAKVMKGIIKRLVFDGFAIPWAKDEKPFDPRVLVGREAWVQIGDGKAADGSAKTQVTAVAQTPEGLPVRMAGARTAPAGNDARAEPAPRRRR